MSLEHCYLVSNMGSEERKPRIRFKGFTDDWEQRKFSDLVIIERGGSPRPIEDFITDSADGLNWVKIGDAPEQGNYITKTAEKIRPEEEQKYAHMIIRDIQNSTLEYDESMTIIDYIASYKSKAKNDEISSVAAMIGLPESSLREFMSYHVTENNIDEFGRFEKLKLDINIEVAQKYFEEKEGGPIPRRKIHPRIDRFLRLFILEGIIE